MNGEPVLLNQLNNITWHFRHALSTTEKQAILNIFQQKGTLVKQNKNRCVYSLQLENGVRVFLKWNRPAGLRECLKRVWKKKGKTEYLSACSVYDKNISSATPLAWGKKGKDSFFLAVEIPNVESAGSVWEHIHSCPEERLQFVTAFGKFVAQLFEKGIFHSDFHAGNVVVRQDKNHYCFFLIDTDGVSCPRQLQCGHAVQMLAGFYFLVRGYGTSEKNAFFTPVLPFTGQSSQEQLQSLVLAEKRCRRAKKWAGLRSRLLHAGSLVYEKQTAEGKWLALREVPEQLLDISLQEYGKNCQSGNLLKNDSKRRLGRIEGPGGIYIVKEYDRIRWFGHWRYDAAAWLGTHRLDRGKFPVARALAWLKKPQGGMIIFEWKGEKNLLHTLRTASLERRKVLLSHAGRLLAELHNSGILHGDTKTSNFMVPDEDDTLFLVDCDAVKMNRRVNEKKCRLERELFEETLPSGVNSSERRVFLDAYTESRISETSFNSANNLKNFNKTKIITL